MYKHNHEISSVQDEISWWKVGKHRLVLILSVQLGRKNIDFPLWNDYHPHQRLSNLYIIPYAWYTDCEMEEIMMHEIKESDWKIFRELRSIALERFCQQILSEVKNIDADSAGSFHQKYLDIFRLIQRRDKEIARIFDNPRRSNALIQLAEILSRDLLSADESLRFSQETRNIIARRLGTETAGGG